MSSRILAFEIPLPADPGMLDQYLALGWYQLDDPPRLKWSFARGSPCHPGESQGSPVNVTLRMLDVALLHELERHLPIAGSFDGNHIDLHAVITVIFQKVERRQRHKGAPLIAAWKASDAELTVLPVDETRPLGTSNDQAIS